LSRGPRPEFVQFATFACAVVRGIAQTRRSALARDRTDGGSHCLYGAGVSTPLPDQTKRRLQRLLERRRRLEDDCTAAADALADAARVACDEEGASRSAVAQALGVGTSTVQGWVNRGRQLAQNRR
jgi:DNA-directed RNA polymerase specialized sigma24 family protein